MNIDDLYKAHALMRLRLLRALVEVDYKEADFRRWLARR